MKIAYLLLILGYIYCIDTSKIEVFDSYYNVEYDLTQNLKKQSSYYLFRLPFKAGDKMDIEIKIPNSVSNNFLLEVYEYNYKPNDTQIYDHQNGINQSQISSNISNYEKNSTIYSYTFQVSSNTKNDSYFSINLTIPNYDYTYLYIKINSSKYKYSNIIDLNFSTEYNLNKTLFGDNFIPYGYQIYIRLSNLNEDKLQIQLKTKNTYDKNNAFKVGVCQYKSKPYESEIYYENAAINCKDSLDNISEEDKYYYYYFQTEKDISYISIKIINYISDLDAVSIYIYAEKELPAAIYIMVIVTPILVVGSLIYFILIKLGIIGVKKVE